MSLHIPCEFSVECPDAIPLIGFDSETPDANSYLATGYAQPPMPLGANWGQFGAVVPASSTVSQSDADLLAANAAVAAAEYPPPATPPALPAPIGPEFEMILTEGDKAIDAEGGQPILEE